MDWGECLTKKTARPTRIDIELIKSLKITSENKLKSSDLLEINETTAASKLSLCYDSLRELLESLAVGKGYKIYNHECYVGFLKEVIGNEELAKKFDRLRLLRNSINYYGQSISLADTNGAINDMKILINAIKAML